MELEYGKIHIYPGSYDQFLELKSQRLQAEDMEADRIRIKLRREQEWMLKQPRARQAKSKARQSQFYELVELSKGKNVDKLGKVTGDMKIELFDETKRLGNTVAEFRKASYVLPQTGRILLDEFSYDFRGKERIGVVGSNG